ncbi:hypothetical protein B1790_01960 [Mycobacterium sp. AT1]|nr:hypothetical protein B1790_01960 [Mycobacterium sp. AT1]
MGVRSSAHFGVRGQSRDEAIKEVRECLANFDKIRYRVKDVTVDFGERDSILITLAMSSSDLAQADADAEEAASAIKALLSGSPHSSHWRERQRELILA